MSGVKGKEDVGMRRVGPGAGRQLPRAEGTAPSQPGAKRREWSERRATPAYEDQELPEPRSGQHLNCRQAAGQLSCWD